MVVVYCRHQWCLLLQVTDLDCWPQRRSNLHIIFMLLFINNRPSCLHVLAINCLKVARIIQRANKRTTRRVAIIRWDCHEEPPARSTMLMLMLPLMYSTYPRANLVTKSYELWQLTVVHTVTTDMMGPARVDICRRDGRVCIWQYATVEAYFQSPKRGRPAENFALL